MPTAIDAADGPAAPLGTVVPAAWSGRDTGGVASSGRDASAAPDPLAGPARAATDLADLAQRRTSDALPSADDVVVPDFPPQQDLLPPAPTSPAVQVPPTDSVPVAPGPAPARAATAAPVPVAVPDGAPDSGVGRPRFSVPGLEHVLVEGTEPEPTGPIGFRTPARFARQQAPLRPRSPHDQQPSAPSFDAVLAPPTNPAASEPVQSGAAEHAAVVPLGRDRPDAPGADAHHVATSHGVAGTAPAPGREDALSVATMPLETVDLPDGAPAARSTRRRSWRPRSGARADRAAAPATRTGVPGARAGADDRPGGARTGTGHRARTRADAGAGDHAVRASRSDGRAPRLPAGSATTSTDRRPAVSPTTGGPLGALTGATTLALAAWWFSAPATVHATGIALGIVALVLSVTVLRDPTATWQRPLALLGAVLGGVGTLVLLWAVAAALLGAGGTALPDLTGTGVVPTVAP